MQYSIVNLSEVKNKSCDFFILSPDFFSKENYECSNKLNTNNNILLDFFEPNKKTIKKIEEKSINYDLTNSLGNFLENGELIDKINCEKISLIEGSFIISRLRSYLQEFAIVEKNDLKQVASTEYLSYFPKNEEIFSSALLLAFTKTKYVQKILNSSQYGTEHPRFYEFVFDRMPINLNILKLNKVVKELIEQCFTLRQSADTLYKEAENILLEELGLKDFKPQNKKCFIKNLSNTQEVGRFDAEYFQPKYEDIIEKIKGYKGGYFVLKDEDVNDKNFNPKKDVCYKYIELSNISNNATINNVEMITGDNLPTRARRIVKTNDIIVSSVEGSLNSISLITENYNNSLCSTGFFVLKTQKLNSESLLIFLKSIIGQMQLKRGCKGTILTSIDKNELKQIIIPLLPLSIQTLISSKIQQSFENREKSKQLLEVAKRAVEIAIEENEEAGLKYIEENK